MYVVQPYHKDPTLQGKHMRKSRVMQVLYCKENMIYSTVDLADHTNQQIMEL